MRAFTSLFFSVFVLLNWLSATDALEADSSDWKRGICDHEDLDQSKDFNEIKFTQTWGYAECLDFKEGHGHGTKCQYEDRASIFSIHGIWPTQTGTSGPNCCEKVKFDHTLLDPIRSQLDLYWYEISATRDPYEFWGHEWVKHGSCAKVLPTFSDELKYFQGGLDLRKRFDLYTALKNANIHPQHAEEKGYHISLIRQAFLKAFGVTPYVQCLHTKSGELHLLAVEVCLDRNLTPLDCSSAPHETRHAAFGSAGPCPDDQILYQDTVVAERAEL